MSSEQKAAEQTGRELTPQEREEVRSQIVAFLAEECDVDPSEIRDESDLVADLGVDSLAFLELFEELRNTTNLEVDVRTVVRYGRDQSVSRLGELLEQVYLFMEGKIELEPPKDTETGE
jgi:acyl carrier protein